MPDTQREIGNSLAVARGPEPGREAIRGPAAGQSFVLGHVEFWAE